MELQSIAFELGLERLQTETTFVKDETLKKHCQQFDRDVKEERFFRQAQPVYMTEMEHAIASIQRASLPAGSNLFQQAMEEYERIHRQAATKDDCGEDNTEESDVVEHRMKTEKQKMTKRPSQRKASLVYPNQGKPTLRRLYSVQLDRYAVPSQNFGRSKR